MMNLGVIIIVIEYSNHSLGGIVSFCEGINRFVAGSGQLSRNSIYDDQNKAVHGYNKPVIIAM